MKKQKRLFSLKKAICFLLVLSLMLLPLSAFAGETGAGSGRTKEAFRCYFTYLFPIYYFYLIIPEFGF